MASCTNRDAYGLECRGILGSVPITRMQTRTALSVIAVILLISAALQLIVIRLARRWDDSAGPTETTTRAMASA